MSSELVTSHLPILFGIFGVLIVIIVFTKKLWNRNSSDSRFRPYSSLHLFTNSEKNFLRALDSAVGNKYRVLGKVRIADVITPQKNLSKKSWNKYFWQISSKHIDFLLVDKNSFFPILAIELNDRSHLKKDRSSRDAMVGKAFSSAKVPLLWVTATRSYDKESLLQKIETKISQRNSL